MKKAPPPLPRTDSPPADSPPRQAVAENAIPATIIVNLPQEGTADHTIIELSSSDVIQLEDEVARSDQSALIITLPTGQIIRFGPFSRTERAAPIISIGRTQRCTITIDHKEVSRQHAEISFRDGTFYLRDCGSAGGTFLDGKPVFETQLASAQTFSLARAVLVRTRVVVAPR
jgi:hypothetical protein